MVNKKAKIEYLNLLIICEIKMLSLKANLREN